jgi:hypothetical protein
LLAYPICSAPVASKEIGPSVLSNVTAPHWWQANRNTVSRSSPFRPVRLHLVTSHVFVPASGHDGAWALAGLKSKYKVRMPM